MNGYSEALDYLYGLEQFGIVFGLDHITRILSLIGDPQTSLRAVHIAGTNGKGSVASVVAAIAQQAGYRVGLYTSPHLISFTERITVDGTPITEGEVVELTQFIRGRIEASGASIEGNDPQTGAPAGLPVEGATRASDRQFIEGEALPALPVEGATRAPLIEGRLEEWNAGRVGEVK
jgi:hypothetical protein